MTIKLITSSQVLLPTPNGLFKCFVVKEKSSSYEHMVIFKGEIKDTDCLVRVHSECLTGEVFGSERCDCGYQLDQSLSVIGKDGGVLIYLRQEGRGIGLFNKIEAYKLQEMGLDTVEANLKLGLPIDARDYLIAATLLKQLAPRSIRLITNNPEKIDSLKKLLDIPITRVSIQPKPNNHNRNYLLTKAIKLKHFIEEV